MERFHQNTVLDALMKCILVFASIHIVILFFNAVMARSLLPFNIFYILNIQELSPTRFQDFAGNLMSMTIIFGVFFFFYYRNIKK